jgi:glycosyltransferase involved in cell wall biosynthesis
MNSADISVCLPVWNGSKFLEQSIESVLSQNFGNFELIISDDASSDESRDILRSFERKDPRIRLVLNDHRVGLFENYNRCITKATAPIVKLFAQDDRLLPHHLGEVMRAFRCEPDLALISTAKRLINIDGELLRGDDLISPVDHFDDASNRTLDGNLVAKRLLETGQNFIGEPSTVSFRKPDKEVLFDPSFYHVGDLEYWLRLLTRGRFQFLPQVLCEFRRHADAATAKNNRLILFARDLVLLFRKHEQLSTALGIDLSEQRKNLVRGMCMHLDHLESMGSVQIDTMRASEPEMQKLLEEMSGPELIAELILTREFAFLAASMLGEHENKDGKRTRQWKESLLREHEIARLENSIRNLLTSVSWQLTRPLRELRARVMGAQSVPEIRFHPDSLDNYAEIELRQIKYLEYLKRLERDILSSRSWKITASLRLLN